MRFLLAFVLSFISVFAIAQAPPMAIGGPQGITVKRALIEDWISIPIMSDTPVAPLIGATWPGRGYIVHVAKLGDTSVWHYTGKRWMKIGGAAEDNYTYLLTGGKVSKNNTLNRFTVGQAIYYINGTRYQSSFTQINGFPKTPNANGRIDIIALSSTGPLIIQGTESPNPITPNLGSTRISLGLAYYAPFDSLANLSGNGLTSVFIKRGVDSIFFTTSDTTIAIRDSVGRPVAGNLIDVSKDTVIFGDTMIKNTVFNTNGYTYRILKSGGDTVLNINPTGNIIIKSRQVGDTTGLFSTNIKGNRIAFIDSIQGNESSEPKMLIQYPLSNPGVSIYPVGTLGGLNTDTRSSLNTISGNGVGLIGAWTHTSLGSHSGGGNVTFYKDRVPAGNYRRNTNGLNLEKNDVVFNLSANGGYYATSVASPSYKGLGGLQISVDSLFGTNYRSRIQFLTNDASSATASEKMRLSNNGNLLIGSTFDSSYKLQVTGSARVSGDTYYNGNLIPEKTPGMLSLGMIGGSTSKLQAYTNGGGAAIQSIDFDYFQTTLNSGSYFDSSAFGYDLNKFRTIGEITSQNGGGTVITDIRMSPTFRVGPRSTDTSTYYGARFVPIVDSANKVNIIPFSNTIGSNMLNTTSGNTRIGYPYGFQTPIQFDTTYKLDVNGTGRFRGDVRIDNLGYLRIPTNNKIQLGDNGSSYGFNTFISSVMPNVEGQRNTYIGYTDGHNNTNGDDNTIIGSVNNRSNITGSNNVIVGSNIRNYLGLSMTQNNTIMIGSTYYTPSTTTFDKVIGLGFNTKFSGGGTYSNIMDFYGGSGRPQNNSLNFGSSDVNGIQLDNVYFNGNTNSNGYNGRSITINGSGAATSLGNNRNGGDIIIAGGKGAGTGTPGFVAFSTSTTLSNPADSLTLQTLTERARISPAGNLLVGRTVDSIYKLDVNGTGRFSNNVTIDSALFLNGWKFGVDTISGSNALLITTPTSGRYLMFSRQNSSEGYGNFQYAGFSNGDSRFVFSSTDFNSSNPDQSALVSLNSNTAGFLSPRMTNTQRDAISSPAQGLQLFSTTDSANYVYRGSSGGWQKIANEISGSATLDFGNTSAQNSADLTVTVTGAADGDVVSLGVPNGSVNANTCFTAWVSATDTVTVRFNNYSGGAVDPASGTFKIKVLK